MWNWRGARRLALAGLLFGSDEPSAAAAHAPPEIARVLWRDAQTLVLASNRGLMFGDLTNRSFRLMCNEALHLTPSEIPQLALRADGGLLAATSRGLFLTRDEGCNWQGVAPLVDLFVPALAQHADQLDTVYLASFGEGQSALRVSHDGGQSWSVLVPLADRDYTRSLRVAPSDAAVLYATGTAFAEPPAPLETHYIARSIDAGKTWKRHAVALEEGELALLLLAVNPKDPDELLLRAMSASPGFAHERLLLSQDGGETLSAPLTLLDIEAGAFSTDGASVWVAGREGLFQADVTRSKFQRVGAADYLTCLDVHGTQLFACGHYAGIDPERDGIGSTAVGSDRFDSRMDFRDVRTPVECPESSATASACASPWRDFHDEILRPFAVDAGGEAGVDGGELDGGAQPSAVESASADAATPAVDAALPAAMGPTRAHATGCSLRPRSMTTDGPFIALLGLLWAWLARRGGAQSGIASRRDSRSHPRAMR